VELYRNGTILDIYRKARSELRRPWIVDDFETIKGRLRPTAEEGGYRKVLILMDNSGADAVLGVLPLARELVTKGAEVVFACNSLPALNDITAEEMQEVLAKAAEVCPALGRAVQAGKASVVANGSGSPCINLRLVSEELAKAAEGVDLLVIEGMGRAVHTNLHTVFSCDCIKLAMIKNQRVATQLFQGQIYDCVCKFDPAVGSM